MGNTESKDSECATGCISVTAGIRFEHSECISKLNSWLVDDAMGTSQRKVLVIVGPEGSGKSALLNRIAMIKIKGEVPRFIEPDRHGHILHRKESYRRMRPALWALQDQKLVLMDDLDMHRSCTVQELMMVAAGSQVKVRRPRSCTEIDTFTPAASVAVAVRADLEDRATRLMADVDCECRYFVVLRLTAQ